jgi:hypothetical protein
MAGEIGPAKQPVSVELFYSGTWHQVADETLVVEEIDVQWGQSDESAALRPSSVDLTLNNAADTYRPSNPESPLYGLVGRNTPLRVSVDSNVRMSVEVSAFKPDRTIDFREAVGAQPARGRSVVDVDGSGLLRRINQWSRRISDALTTWDTTSIANLLGYWPLDDPRGTAVPRSLVPAGASYAKLPDFEAEYGSTGTDDKARVNEFAYLAGDFAVSSSLTAGWSIFFSMRLPNSPAGAMFLNTFSYTSTKGFGFVVFNDPDIQLQVYDLDGVNVVTAFANVSAIDFTKWNHFVIRCSVSAGTVTMELDWWTEGLTSLFGISGTYAGTVTGAPSTWRMDGNAPAAPLALGHVGGCLGVPNNTESVGRFEASAGHAGELAGERWQRLLDQEAILWTFLGSTSTTEPMGPQTSGWLPDILEEITTTEDGLTYDSRDNSRLVFRTRNDRYATMAGVALALTYPDQVAYPFREVIDDLDTHNTITVHDTYTGDEAENTLASGPMSTLNPPNGVGEYRQTVDVRVFSPADQLPVQAGWWLNRGTLNRSRYPAVTLDLVANPELVDDANEVALGDVISIDGYEPDTIYLMVIGTSERIGSHTRTLTFVTVPAELFMPAVYGDTRYNVDGTALAEDITLTETLWDITSPTPWRMAGGYDVVCNGERVGVVSATAPAGTLGAYTQTLTTARSKNGISRTHASGDEIRVYNGGRYAR